MSVYEETKGVERHVVRSHHRLLSDKEEKELAMRPILPWSVPTCGRCAQAHTVLQVHARPNAFPKRPFPHLLQNLGSHTTAGHCNVSDFPRDVSNQWPTSVGVLQALQRFVQGYDWVFELLFTQLQAFFSSQRCCLCELGHSTGVSFVLSCETRGPILRNRGPIRRNTVSLNRTGHK